MSAASDYLAHVKATRAKFFPQHRPVVARSLVREKPIAVIYTSPIGPTNKHIRLGYRKIYSHPIGPVMPDMEIGTDPAPTVDFEWIAQARRRFLLDAKITAPEVVCAHICEVLCQFSVSLSVVRSGSRMKVATAARRHIYFRLHTQCGWSTPRIGALLRKDHSSVVCGIQRHVYLRSRGLEGVA